LNSGIRNGRKIWEVIFNGGINSRVGGGLDGRTSYGCIGGDKRQIWGYGLLQSPKDKKFDARFIAWIAQGTYTGWTVFGDEWVFSA